MKKTIFLPLIVCVIFFSGISAQELYKGISSENGIIISAGKQTDLVKEILIAGTDSIQASYELTFYTQFHGWGQPFERITIDTLRSKYLSTDYGKIDPSGKFLLFLHTIDTVYHDTLADYTNTFNSTGHVKLQRGNFGKGLINQYREVFIDSAGYNLYDSSYAWSANKWNLRNTTRSYYTFNGGGRLASRTDVYGDSVKATTKLKYEYLYVDTLLNVVKYYLTIPGAPFGSEQVAYIYTYPDKYGSYADTSLNTKEYVYYASNGKYLGFKIQDYDPDAKSWDRNTVIYKYKYSADGKLSEAENIFGLGGYYKSLFSYPASMGVLAVNHRNDAGAGVSIYPSPVKDILQLHVSDEQLTIQSITVRNALGQTLITQSGGNLFMPVATIPSGVCNIEIQTNKGPIRKTLIVE